MLRIEQLTSNIGAHVKDLDPREATDAHVAAIRAALAEHGTLVLRAPGMTADEQVAFAGRFGPVHGHPVREFLTGQLAEPIAVVENDKDKPPQDNQNLHTDYSFNTEIPDLAILRPEVLPPHGGDTVWSSTIAAYDGLSEPMKQFLDPLRAVHDAGEQFWFEIARTLGPEMLQKARARFDGTTHPVVSLHPHSKQRLLFVNRGYTTNVVGLSPRESASLLALLFDQQTRPGVPLSASLAAR